MPFLLPNQQRQSTDGTVQICLLLLLLLLLLLVLCAWCERDYQLEASCVLFSVTGRQQMSELVQHVSGLVSSHQICAVTLV